MAERIYVNKVVLEWAIRESGMSDDQALKKNPIIRKIIEESIYPTFSQLKSVSDFLKVPFGMLFLETPPKTENFMVEFRTLNNKMNSNFSKDLKDTILEMDYRKSWMSEYRKNNNHDKLELPIINTENDTNDTINTLYNLLKLKSDWYRSCKGTRSAFNYIRDRIEALGILVMINGVVGNNTHRTLDITEFRAFVLRDDYSPLIFINRNDTDSGMLFSLLHEFVHLLSDESQDDIFIELTNSSKNESRINAIVAELLVPEKLLLEIFNFKNNPIEEVKRVAKELNISSTVVAIKAFNLKLITYYQKNNIISEATHYFMVTKSNREKKGGDFYSNTMSRMSKDYYTTVIHQAEGGTIQFTEAFKLLSLRASTYDNFKRRVESKLYE